MIRLTQVALPVETDCSDAIALAAAVTGLPRTALVSARLWKRSVDARRGIRFICSIVLEAPGHEPALLARTELHAEPFEWPHWSPELPPMLGKARRAAVIGSGPAGLAAAYLLARAGVCSVIYERGDDVERRVAAVEHFWRGGALDENSNVLFGEGGAGTFSDGKLRTGIKDPRCRAILETMVALGAPPDILYEENPHIGTDGLRLLLPAMRARIEAMGGAFRFRHRLTGLRIESGKPLITLDTPEGTLCESADAVVLAPGHSARDTFRMLHTAGLVMEAKAFAMGVRIEHHQAALDTAQYRLPAGHARGAYLPPSEYRLSTDTPSGRKLFSFCMCPGGQVVLSASAAGELAVNGMSLHARDGENANAALLVPVGPDDFGAADALAGLRFQEHWERAAFALGGGHWQAPAQTVGSFLHGRPNVPGAVQPSCPTGVTFTDITKALPAPVALALRQGLPMLGRRIRGFDDDSAVLTAIESRSSSPVRMTRDEAGLGSLPGVYPCGEGAGYAGGILSAAADGLRAAERVLAGLSVKR